MRHKPSKNLINTVNNLGRIYRGQPVPSEGLSCKDVEHVGRLSIKGAPGIIVIQEFQNWLGRINYCGALGLGITPSGEAPAVVIATEGKFEQVMDKLEKRLAEMTIDALQNHLDGKEELPGMKYLRENIVLRSEVEAIGAN